MQANIPISLDRKDHIAAAQALSNYLDQRGIRHAYIGGFAWSLLGSVRPTDISLLLSLVNRISTNGSVYDIDILIHIEVAAMEQLRAFLRDVDKRFDTARVKLFFITDEQITESPTIAQGKRRVVVETLPTGSLGLPREIPDGAIYCPDEYEIKLLHPGLLILTKLKRWAMNCNSTRHKTILKNQSDRRDIRFIINWLSQNGPEHIRFDDYRGKTKPELLQWIRRYHDKYVEDDEHIQHLRSIMPDDWDDMLALSIPQEESYVVPPDLVPIGGVSVPP